MPCRLTNDPTCTHMPNAVTDDVHVSSPTAELPLVSVVVPCRNESAHIRSCLESLVTQTWPKEHLEVLVVDGISDDGTRAIIAGFTAAYPWIRLIDNTRRTTPTALNIGICQSLGEIVCRMDAHCKYPNDYIAALLSKLHASGADNVGGVCRTLPANQGPMARTIAAALAHPFAVGNAHFRTGASAVRWVDTVPFGCYRRSVFSRVGLFDEELVRNQDDEFNHRLLKHGGRILLVPSVVIDYYGRSSIAKVARMMFQYGYFKPLAARKLGRVSTVRQLVPPVFVAGMTTLLLLAPWWSVASWLWLTGVGLYVAMLLVGAIREARKGAVTVAVRLPSVIAVIHFCYGAGYLAGVWTHVVRRRSRGPRRDRPELQLTR